jgi:ketosteroid isomerase-like protein
MVVAALLAAAVAALPADLAKAAHDYDQAQVRSDRAELERLLADDYVLQNSAGRVQDKTGFIADQVAPGYRLEPFQVEEPVEKVMGDVALLGGVATLRGTDGGKAYSVRLRFVDVWRKRDGRWQVVFTQATRAPAANPAS